MRNEPGLPGYVRFLALVGALLTTAGCTLDAFLFNEQPIDSYALPGNTIPANLLQAVSFQSGGNTLYGYWVGSNGGRPGITIIYFHGNKHNLDEYWDRVMFLHDTGVNVFIFDYRGFGKSTGVSSEVGLHEDANAALQQVLSRPGVFPDSLVFYGYSLGNVPSIYLAAETMTPLVLIAESPFASALSLAQGSLALALPQGWLTEGRFDNLAEVVKIRAPLLVMHGEDDDFVRYRENGRVIYQGAPEPKALRLVPGALHEDVPQTMGLAAYRAAIISWINLSAIAP